MVSPLPLSYWRRFPGTPGQIRVARSFAAGLIRDCPAADDIVLCTSELATNAVRHSASGGSGGVFTVGVEVTAGVRVVVRVCDEGGPWRTGTDDDERLHGLGIVRSLAAGLRVTGDAVTGWVVIAWFGWNPGAVIEMGAA
jgi:anti-sigma regulatory factor (Ser/Thr protein kinase)